MLDRGDAERRARALNDGAFAPLTGVTALARGAGSAIWVAAQGRLFKVDVDANEPGGRLTEALRDLGSGLGAGGRSARATCGSDVSDAELLRYRPADGRDRSLSAGRRATRWRSCRARAGEIWIGARGGGLSRLDPATGDLVVYRHDPEDPASLSSDDVAAIYEDAIGSLWIGSWNGGVRSVRSARAGVPHVQAPRRARRSRCRPTTSSR